MGASDRILAKQVTLALGMPMTVLLGSCHHLTKNRGTLKNARSMAKSGRELFSFLFVDKVTEAVDGEQAIAVLRSRNRGGLD